MADAGRQTTERSADVARRAASGSSRAAQDALAAEGDLARLWLEATSEQMRHQVETFQRLVAARDWREAAEIQSSFVRESVSRMANLMASQLELSSALTSRMLAAGRDQIDRVA
jgi:phasin family protein